MPSKKINAASLDQWMLKYKEAWEQFDSEMALSLFAPNASYYETPFDAPITGYDALYAYWASAPHFQKDVHFDYEVIHLKGTTGWCKWKVMYYHWATGESVSIDGIFEIQFTSDGRCAELRSWWHLKTQPLDLFPAY